MPTALHFFIKASASWRIISNGAEACRQCFGCTARENARLSFNNTIKVVHSFFIDNFRQKAKSGRHLFQAELRSSAAFARDILIEVTLKCKSFLN